MFYIGSEFALQQQSQGTIQILMGITKALGTWMGLRYACSLITPYPSSKCVFSSLLS